MSIYILVLLCFGIIMAPLQFIIGAWAGDTGKDTTFAVGLLLSIISLVCFIIAVIFQACILAGV